MKLPTLPNPFRRRPPPTTDTAMTAVPANLDVAHSYTAPTGGPTEYRYGVIPYADRPGVVLPAVTGQDARMIPADRQPPGAPGPYWSDRNASRLRFAAQEQPDPLPHTATITPEFFADNPWLHTPRSPRPTSTYSPSTYRFYAPFDQRIAHRSNTGTVYSAATLPGGYPIGGMTAPVPRRNTLRVIPTPRDIENVDLTAPTVAAVDPAVYVSPHPAGEIDPASRWIL